MALEFARAAGVGPGSTWTCDRRLCLVEGRSRVVPEDSVEARWLWATPGDVIPMAEAIRLGAVVPAAPEAAPAEAPAAEAEPAADEAPDAEPDGEAVEGEKPAPAKRAASKRA